jgi:hypothetical protein
VTPRVAFHAAFRFHTPILAPIRDALGARAGSLLTGERSDVCAFDPHVLVLAASTHLEYFRRHLPRTFIVNVHHGMIGKGGLRRLPARRSARSFDAVVVWSPLQVARYERSGARPAELWATGYPHLDALFRPTGAPPLPLPAGRPTVLYAPTWNLGLTSATMLGARLVECLRAQAPGVNVVVKPHPVIGDWRPRWMATWKRLADTLPGVHLVTDAHADIVPYLLASDVMVSDASSVIFEFLALDRPIVLVTNPRHRADPAWEPDDIVWRWRDVGHEVHDRDGLSAAVAEALAHPERHGDRRRAYAAELFGEFTDGRNHARIAERVLEAGARVLRGGHPPAPPVRWLPFVRRRARVWLGAQPVLRRALLGPLEAVRLALRGRRGSAPVVRSGPGPVSVHGRRD